MSSWDGVVPAPNRLLLTEQQLLDKTIDLAERCRWAVHHDRAARTNRGWRTAIQGHAGFPDLVLIRAGHAIYRELKGYDARGRLGKLSSEQYDWGRQIDPHWRPAMSWAAPAIRIDLRFDVWIPDDFDTVIRPTLTARPVKR